MKKFYLKKAAFILSALLISFGVSLASCSNGSSGNNETGTFEWCGSKKYKSPVALPELSNQSEKLEDSWWKNSAFYHIWVKSFKDSDVNDCSKNCGDFKGIEDSLDYIQKDLGCDAIWLSPIFDCAYKGDTNSKSASMNMHGYDITDYYKLNPYFGTGDGSKVEEELDSLIKACHERGMKIIFDFVPNHTSNKNPWFLDSAEGKNGKKDWYVWSDTPNGWKDNYGNSAWHKMKDKYYYAVFTDGSPDLNFRNWEVREEMKNITRYWLNRGFDGLRIDAARHLIESETSTVDTAETHEYFQELRKLIDEYDSPKFMVCESWVVGDRDATNKYFGTQDKPEFNMVFDFDQGKPIVEAVYVKAASIYYNNVFAHSLYDCLFNTPYDYQSYGTFLGNHDEYAGRLGDWLGSGTTKQTILATAMSLIRPTVPFIYYGNEIAQKSANIDGDFALRKPFNWQMANSQIKNSGSLLNVNKKLLALRKSSKYADLFAKGKIELLPIDMWYNDDPNSVWDHAIAYTISNDAQKLLVIANLTENQQVRFWFHADNLVFDTYSLIIGNDDASKTLYLASYDNGTKDLVTVDYAPHEIKVFDLTSSTETCIIDEWDYTISTMFLRGGMNSWGNTPMTYNSTSGVFEATVELVADTKYEFKFDENADWTHAYGASDALSGNLTLNQEAESSDVPGMANNFSFTPASDGEYVFIFNPKNGKVQVAK